MLSARNSISYWWPLLLLVLVLPVIAATETGYATAIYHNRGDWKSAVIFGRQVVCTLREASRDDALDCAMAWCEDWCERSGNQTCRCRRGRAADAKAKGEITQIESSKNTYTRKKQ